MRPNTTLIALIALIAASYGCRSPTAPARSTGKTAKNGKLPVPDAADPREAVIAPVIARILERDHLRGAPVDDKISKKAFDEYVDALDPGKQFLLGSHVKKLAAHRAKMDDQLKSGQLALAHIASALMRSRVAVVKKIVGEALTSPMRFDRDEQVQTDGEKRDWATDDTALADRWRKLLKLEVLARIRRMGETLDALEEAKKKQKKGGKNESGKNESGKSDKESDKDEATEALERAAARIPKTTKERIRKARADLKKRYDGRLTRLAKAEPLEGAATFINAIAQQYDPHTSYLAPATKENFDISMSGSLEGIGAVLSEDEHYIRVERLVAGGASWRQGDLEAGDVIIAVAQESKPPVDVIDMRLQRVVGMIRGPKGTVVTLTVKKPDDRIKVIAIVRDVIKIETAYARGALVSPVSGGSKIGYIYLPSFYGNTRARPGMTPDRRAATDVRQLLQRFKQRKVAGVVLDLRGNGGGLLEDAREISGLFIDVGPIVQTHGRDGAVEVLRDGDKGAVFGGPLVVMVDRSSASASEIVSGALQDYGRALIVGSGATYGKGTVQVIVGLDRLVGRTRPPSLGVLKLTRHQFFRISGASTQLRGVEPDVRLVDPAAYIKSGERRLPNALPWSRVKAVPFSPWPKRGWKIAALRAASEARQARSGFFIKLQARNKLLKSRQEQTIVPLERSKWRAWVDKRKKELDAVTPDNSKEPALLRAELVVYRKTTTPARPGKRHKKGGATPAQRWRDGLTRDPWLTEATQVLEEMAAAQGGKSAAR